MQDANADIMCFGHTRKPFHRIMAIQSDDNTTYRHAINIGSVGKPKDGNPQGCFVILEIDYDSNLANRDSVQSSFIRFDYDVEKAAKAIEESILPDQNAEMLRIGN